MRCAQTRWRVSRATDDRTSKAALPPATARHLESCSKCTRFRDGLESMGKQLAGSAAFAPTPDAKHIEPKTSRGWPAVAALASAAALVLVVWLSMTRTATLASLPDVDGIDALDIDRDVLAPAPVMLAKDDPLVDVDALAGDASGGLRYVLRVSGLSN